MNLFDDKGPVDSWWRNLYWELGMYAFEDKFILWEIYKACITDSEVRLVFELFWPKPIHYWGPQ